MLFITLHRTLSGNNNIKGEHCQNELQLYRTQHAGADRYHGLLFFPAEASDPPESGFPRHSGHRYLYGDL